MRVAFLPVSKFVFAVAAVAVIGAGIDQQSVFGAAAPIPYPVDSDGAQTANVARRYTVGGQLLTNSSFADMVNLVNHENGPSAGVDGAGTNWVLNSSAPSSETTSVKARYTLDQVYSLKKFVTTFGFAHMPTHYEVWTSTTGFGALTQAVTSTATSFGFGEIYKNVLTTPVDAKFLEIRMQGVGGQQMMLTEAQMFVDGAAPQLMSDMGYNITSLGGMTATATAPGKWLDNVAVAIDRVVDFNNKLRGANNGAASFVVDLGAEFNLTSMSTGFLHNHAWNAGAKVEVSTDSVNYFTVREQLAGNFGTQSFQSRAGNVRYVRVTNNNGSDNSFTELEIFTPEPAGGLIACLCIAFLMRRKR